MEQKRYLQLHRSHKKRYCVCVPLDSVPRFFCVTMEECVKTRQQQRRKENIEGWVFARPTSLSVLFT